MWFLIACQVQSEISFETFKVWDQFSDEPEEKLIACSKIEQVRKIKERWIRDGSYDPSLKEFAITPWRKTAYDADYRSLVMLETGRWFLVQETYEEIVKICQ